MITNFYYINNVFFFLSFALFSITIFQSFIINCQDVRQIFAVDLKLVIILNKTLLQLNASNFFRTLNNFNSNNMNNNKITVYSVV